MRIKNEMAFWFAILGGVVAAVPVINLIYRFFSPELAPTMVAFLEFYRGIFRVLLDAILSWTDWRPDQFFIDIFVVNSIFVLAGIRALLLEPKQIGFSTALSVIVSFVPPVGLLLLPAMLFQLKNGWTEEDTIFFGSILACIVSSIIFFGINAAILA